MIFEFYFILPFCYPGQAHQHEKNLRTYHPHTWIYDFPNSDIFAFLPIDHLTPFPEIFEILPLPYPRPSNLISKEADKILGEVRILCLTE